MTANALATVLAYHQRSKHRLDAYAAGPATLDWSAQPSPFRSYGATPKVLLSLAADQLDTPFSALDQSGAVASRPLDCAHLACLLEISLALAAWKE